MASPEMHGACAQDAVNALSADELERVRNVCRRHRFARKLYLSGSRVRWLTLSAVSYGLRAMRV